MIRIEQIRNYFPAQIRLRFFKQCETCISEMAVSEQRKGEIFAA